MFARLPIRSLPRAVAPTLRRAPVARRSLATSPVRRASEPQDPPPIMPAAMDKLLGSPKAMAAVERLMQLLESKGVDVKSGKPPSMFQLAKIAADGEVRQKVSEVMTELKDAGVDVSPEKLQQLLGGNNPFGNGSEGEKK